MALSGAGLLVLGIPLIAIAASRGAERYLLREEGTTDEICLGILQVTRG